MAQEVKLTVTLEATLADRLKAVATERGWSPESLASECVAQALEVAIRHRVLIERMEQIDGAILDMAQAVGDLGAPSGSIDLSKVCRFRKGAGVADPAP
jgi:hypothetical protein